MALNTRSSMCLPGVMVFWVCCLSCTHHCLRTLANPWLSGHVGWTALDIVVFLLTSGCLFIEYFILGLWTDLYSDTYFADYDTKNFTADISEIAWLRKYQRTFLALLMFIVIFQFLEGMPQPVGFATNWIMTKCGRPESQHVLQLDHEYV